MTFNQPPDQHSEMTAWIWELVALRDESYFDFRTQFVIMTQITLTDNPCYLCHFQIFDESNSLLKNVFNVLACKKGTLHLQRTALFTMNCFSNYLKKRNFSEYFFYISHGFNFAIWLQVDFSRGFIFANLSFINVLYFYLGFFFS